MPWENTDDDLIESAMGLIANAGGGNWETQTEEWQQAAAAWMERFRARLRGTTP